MGRSRKSDEPLVIVTFRVPPVVRDAIYIEAAENGVTASDVIRSHFSEEAIKPLGQPRPSRRPQRLAEPEGSPELAAQLAKIGNNLNQIARQINSDARLGDIDAISALEKLATIELEIKGLK